MRTTVARMDLGGLWRVAESRDDLRRGIADADLDDSGWSTHPVPGHWRGAPGLEHSDGPVLYRRRFECPPAGSGPAETGDGRAFVVFDGIFYQGDVWLDGEYLGDTEGYFFPHSFEVTEALTERSDHLLAVEVACTRAPDRRAKRNLTGVFEHWGSIDADWNPGGIWAGVRIDRTGPVRIASLGVLCREASEERAVLDIEAALDRREPGPVHIETLVTREGGDETRAAHGQDQNLSAGSNTVRWRVPVERPDLWWPSALGGQPLYRVTVNVTDSGRPSDQRSLVTGLRRIKLRNFIATVNGERLFLKGANLGPARRDIGAATAEEITRDVVLAADAGLDLIRVHAHIARPELYEEADRRGMLIWQDLPLQWGYAHVRKQAVDQARRAVEVLGHHPSIALWCGHNEPMALDPEAGRATAASSVARVAAAQVLPNWNKTGLDRSLRRALERADGSRSVVTHSGVVPHPLWGTDSHFYFGWLYGSERDFPAMMARFPVLARFVSEFGAQAVPETADFMEPQRWPDLDWADLEAHHCFQKDIFDQRLPPERYRSFDEWREATQSYQSIVLRHHIETLRRLKYRPTGGFCLFLLADAQPAVSHSVLDHLRVPKASYAVVARSCAPVIVVADRPSPSYRPGEKVSLDVHVVSDLRTPVEGAVVSAALRWPGGSRAWRFAGDVPADRCVRVGRVSTTLPKDAAAGEMSLELSMTWPDGSASNLYTSQVEM